MDKLLILGPPLTGKTTLAAELRKRTNIPVLDFDDELLKLNDGKYPANYPILNEQLKKQVIEAVLLRDSIIFFAFEVKVDALKKMRQLGFQIFQLTADLATLKERNIKRLKDQPDNDALQYVEINMQYQARVRQLNLIDETIDATQPSADTAQRLLSLISQKSGH